MPYKMTESARTAVLNYILKKLDNGVEMFILESASRTEALCINTLEFALYVEQASLTRLDKIMRVNKDGVELRKVVYESSHSTDVLTFVKKGLMISKPIRLGSWQDGEKEISEVLRGIRTGNKAGHKADTEIHRTHGKTLMIEIKNCEGRLY
jgi:hypothetical protein